MAFVSPQIEPQGLIRYNGIKLIDLSSRKEGAELTVRTDKQGLIPFFRAIAEEHPDPSSIAFVCIGTDRSTGDSYGPIVGSLLKEQGWPRVIGTLERPCDAHSVHRAAAETAGAEAVIAIDACLGKPQSVGMYICRRGALRPGEATSAGLPAVGHYGVEAVVAELGPSPYRTLQTTSLYRVLRMAKETAVAIRAAWPDNALPYLGNNGFDLRSDGE